MKVLVSVCTNLLVVAFLLTGCSNSQSDDGSVKTRLARTIHDLEEYSPNDEALKLLHKATPQTLKSPKIVFARFYASPKNVRLWVEWIGATPTASAILIRNMATGFQRIFPIDQVYVKENKRISKIGVLFRFVQIIEPGSKEWHNMRAQLTDSGAEAVLLRDKTPVSSAVQVELRGWNPNSGWKGSEMLGSQSPRKVQPTTRPAI